MFPEFPFRGEGGGSVKNGQRFPFFLDIELCTRSLKGHCVDSVIHGTIDLLQTISLRGQTPL